MENKPIEDFIKQVKEKLDDSMSLRDFPESVRKGYACPHCGQRSDAERTANALAGMLEIAVSALKEYSGILDGDEGYGKCSADNALDKIQEMTEKQDGE